MTAIAIGATDLRSRIGEILNRVVYTGERFIIKRKGEPVAAIISVAELEQLERLEEEREIEMMRLARLSAEREGVVPFSALISQYEELHGEPLELPELAPDV